MSEAQLEVLEAIARYIGEHGFTPTIRELLAMTGTSSTNGMRQKLQRLERDGYLERIARAGTSKVTAMRLTAAGMRQLTQQGRELAERAGR